MRRGAPLALAVLLAAAPAGAFSRYHAERGAGLFWKQSCVVLTVYLNGFTQLTADQVLKSVAAAAQAWGPDAVACGDAPLTHPSLQIVPTLAPPGATPPPVDDDTRTTLVFRTDVWTKTGLPDGAPLPTSVAAATAVHWAPDGHIIDADIQVNGFGFDWANIDPGVNPSTSGQTNQQFIDLQNTLTHELGHLLGLEHACFRASKADPTVNGEGKTRWNDVSGAPAPDCDGAPAAVARSVMFDGTMPQEVSKRTLSADEIDAMCAIYPAGGASEACALDVEPSGCAVTPAAPRGRGRIALLAAVALVALAARRLSARGRARA